MEIKKGIVKTVQSNGDLKLQHGIFYKFEIQIGDDVGEYLSKSDDGGTKNFPVGSMKDYELTENKFGKKIKPHFSQKSFGPGQTFAESPDRQKMIVKQSSLKVATDLCIANKKTDLDSVFKLADKIVSWVMDDNAGQKIEDGYTSVKKQSVAPLQQKEESKIDNYHSNDLPF
tara:strand:+ start:7888 stop:8403 length:516 start_codon:yes stop_codon:yes gene_type:complete